MKQLTSKYRLVATVLLAGSLIIFSYSPAPAARWGPYDMVYSRSIYYPTNQGVDLRTGWYTTTAGYGAARSVLKASDSYMATMPDASLVTGSSFTVAFTWSGTYSSITNNPLNIFRISSTWDPATALWNFPWAAGGAYTSVSTAAQDVVSPEEVEGTVYTFSPGAGYNFPYGVMMKGDTESSVGYRKGWRGSGPSPTLTVTYTPPAGTANGNIRSWAYLGHYAQGVAADHVTRINTDSVTGTYGGVAVDETQLAPGAADGSAGFSYGNFYGTAKWKSGTGTADVVDLLGAGFYNASSKDNGTTYAAVYVYYTGATTSAAYLGAGSDDDTKVWVNGVLRGSLVLGAGRGAAAAADTDFYGPFPLTQNNWYRVVMKVENGTGGYGLHLRFANADRTALSGTATYTADSTAPSTPTSLAVSGVTSGVWQNSVSAPTFTWTSGTDSQGTDQGVSGVRGQKYYFGTSSSTSPNTFQTGTSYAPGAQVSGTYYFKVDTIDYALNESSASAFTFMYDGTTPTGVSMGFGTVTPDSIAVTGAGTDAPSGVNASTGYNYSRTGASASGGKGTSHTWTGLSANTEYTGLLVTVSDQVIPTPNTAASSAQSKWTLSVAPGAGSVTPDHSTVCSGSPVTWTAVGGFGATKIQYYRYVWDQTPTHGSWTDTETQWTTGTLSTTPTAAGTWYLHVKGYNGANVGNGNYDYSVMVNALPTAPDAERVRGPGGSLKIGISGLGASASVTAVGSGTNGATITKDSTYIYYLPVTGNADTDFFTYTVTDGNVCQKSGNITVTVVREGGVARSVSVVDGKVTIDFAGIPGFQYDVQFSADGLSDWSTVTTIEAPPEGVFTYEDTSPPRSSGYYRLKQH
jgi:hypothetical protein